MIASLLGANMSKVQTVSVAVAIALLLGGCAAAVVPLIAAQVAGVGYAGLKIVQTTTGGSLEIVVDVSKVTDEQQARLKNIRTIAVWPEKRGGSVSFAESLSEGGHFSVVSPSRVAAVLKKLDLSDDLKLMTAMEARDVFFRVCQNTNADAVISTRAAGSATNMNTWSFERANMTMQFVTSIYAKSTNETIVSIPISLKLIVGEKRPPSDEEISNLANAELAKHILTLATGQSKIEQVASRSPQDQPKPDTQRKAETENGKPGSFLDGLTNSVKGLFGTQ
ncbi:MAG: hypothetical protein Q8M11_21495 [Sulfuritalea sp.]|nr:hypothetical protein [Sulfuritalea sp.]